jgi:hypothetical protein
VRPAFSPVKPIDPELPKAAVRRLFDQREGIKRAAIELQRSPSQTYAYADPGVDDEIAFAQVAALTGPTSPACAEYLALLAGGAFVPVSPRQEPLGTLTADAMKDSSEACAELVRATVDGVLTPAEARAALPEIEEMIRSAVQLHAAVSALAKSEVEKK